MKTKLKDMWKKVRGIKHFEILVTVIFGLVLVAIYFLFISPPQTDKTLQESTQEIVQTDEYIDSLENKLCNVLSKISGAGDVNVVLTLQTGFAYEYVSDTETKTTIAGDNETTTVTQTVILVSGEPVIEKEIYPTIKGVVIVAEGADDFSVKMDIISALTNLLEIDEDKIVVLS